MRSEEEVQNCHLIVKETRDWFKVILLERSGCVTISTSSGIYSGLLSTLIKSLSAPITIPHSTDPIVLRRKTLIATRSQGFSERRSTIMGTCCSELLTNPPLTRSSYSRSLSSVYVNDRWDYQREVRHSILRTSTAPQNRTQRFS